MAIFIPDLFSSYVKGREAAIKSNWNDLNQYNQVLGGQLQNALSMDTLDDASTIAHNKALTSNMDTALAGATTDVGLAKAQASLASGLPQAQVAAKIAELQATREVIQKRLQLLDAQIASLQNGGTATTVTPSSTDDDGALNPTF